VSTPPERWRAVEQCITREGRSYQQRDYVRSDQVLLRSISVDGWDMRGAAETKRHRFQTMRRSLMRAASSGILYQVPPPGAATLAADPFLVPLSAPHLR